MNYMPARDRDRINKYLANRTGLDGSGRYNKVGNALAKAAEVLDKYGYELTFIDAFFLRRKSGTHHVDVVTSSNPDRLLDNTSLRLQWYTHPSGKVEVVAYLG